jgi:tetratricopeptide (TPR) repeat protein
VNRSSLVDFTVFIFATHTTYQFLFMLNKFTPAILGVSFTIPFVHISSAQALQPAQVSSIANQVVVFIKTRSGYGSGVVIQQVGDTYTVLTAAHVVSDRRNPPSAIITTDRQKHTINPHSIKISPNRLDLATVTFESPENYAIARLGDSNTIARGQTVFAAGFQGQTLQFYPGKVVAIARQAQTRGYSLVIGNADILPGMSGGALLDRSGALVGINGKSVGTIDPQQSKNGRSNTAKPVSGLAIPINTFAEVANHLAVNVAPKPMVARQQSQTADDFFVAAQNKSQQGNYSGAIADYNRALSLNPNFGEVYFRRGLARNVLKDWQGAMADYTKALEIKPDHAEAYTNRGLIRNILADWRGARLDFDFALILNPRNIFAYVGRGIARCELKDCHGGLQDYNRAIYLNPSYPEAYTSRGMAQHMLGNRQGAVADYTTAAEIYLRQGKDLEYIQTVQKIGAIVRPRG